jgi:hypothetical protein
MLAAGSRHENVRIARKALADREIPGQRFML